MPDLITCSIASSAVSAGKAKAVIQYLPAGVSTIDATVNGEPATREVTVNESVLAQFQADLAAMPKAFIDLYHEAKTKAAKPKAFSWSDELGLMLEIEHTAAGKAEIESGAVEYFSPQFLLSADGVPSGLDVSTAAIGGFVNDPAFEEIQRVAASKKTNQQHNDMSEIDDLKKEVERLTAARDAESVAAAKATTEQAAVNLELDKLKEQVQANKEKAATDAIAVAVTAGKIAKKAESVQASYHKIYLNDPVMGQELLDALPVQNEHVNAGKATATAAPRATDAKVDLVEACRELVTAGKAKNFREATRLLGETAVMADRVSHGLCDPDTRSRFAAAS